MSTLQKLEEMERRNRVIDENFIVKYPDNITAKIASTNTHYCNWLSVKKWEIVDEGGNVWICQDLICQECGMKKKISHKTDKNCFGKKETAKCPCGAEATVVHGTKGLCCAECARS